MTFIERLNRTLIKVISWRIVITASNFLLTFFLTGSWQTGFWVWSILAWVTWLLIIVALIALIRWLWKKGDK